MCVRAEFFVRTLHRDSEPDRLDSPKRAEDADVVIDRHDPRDPEAAAIPGARLARRSDARDPPLFVEQPVRPCLTMRRRGRMAPGSSMDSDGGAA
jgi:hypothetical protein